MGEAILKTLIDDGDLLAKGADHALGHLYSTVRQQWQTRCGEYCEDICGILIRWLGSGSTSTTSASVARAASPSRVAPGQLQAPSLVQYPSHGVASQGYQSSTVGSRPQIAPSTQPVVVSRRVLQSS